MNKINQLFLSLKVWETKKNPTKITPNPEYVNTPGKLSMPIYTATSYPMIGTIK